MQKAQKRPREPEASTSSSRGLSVEEQRWREHHFFVGQLLSYISSDNCYNEVEIVDISDDDAGVSQIKVRYYGWHQDYDRHFDEWIDLRKNENCKRFAKHETGVHRVKCFVHLPGLPYWPCMGFIREPASDDGASELRKYNQIYIEPFGNPKEDKELAKIFKTQSKACRGKQGVHVRYLVNKHPQVLSFKEGIRFAEAKLMDLDGQKKINFAQALEELKKDKSTICSNFELCSLLEDNEQSEFAPDDDDDDDDDDDEDEDYVDIGSLKNKISSSSSSSRNIHQHGNKRAKSTRTRQYYHIQSYAPLTAEQIDNFQELDKDAKTCDRKYRLSLRNKQIEQEPSSSFEEKEFKKMWNNHMFEVGGCYAQRYVPMYCHQFIVKYGMEVMQKKLRFQALLHFTNMVEFGRLSVEELSLIMQQLDALLKEAEARGTTGASSSSSTQHMYC